MKKTVLLNQPLSAVIAGLGHGDRLVIADAGLPIPAEPLRIDLALRCGVPGFLDTLAAVLSEMQVERVLIAEEMGRFSPRVEAALLTILGTVPVQRISHAELKQATHAARAVVRTGECTPYCNIILESGVVF